MFTQMSLAFLSLIILQWWEKAIFIRFRSSHQRYFVRKGVLRDFAKFTGKFLCRPVTLLKRDPGTGVFRWILMMMINDDDDDDDDDDGGVDDDDYDDDDDDDDDDKVLWG